MPYGIMLSHLHYVISLHYTYEQATRFRNSSTIFIGMLRLIGFGGLNAER